MPNFFNFLEIVVVKSSIKDIWQGAKWIYLAGIYLLKANNKNMRTTQGCS